MEHSTTCNMIRYPEEIENPNSSIFLEEDSIVVIMPDGPGSKGDEAIARGLCHVLSGEKFIVFTPGTVPWEWEIPDFSDCFISYCIPVEEMHKYLNRRIRLVIAGTDGMDGTCGVAQSLSMLESAKAVLSAGGSVKVFCSFRSDVNEEILCKIKELEGDIGFYLREEESIDNFNRQTGLKGRYFPDFAYYCEKLYTDRAAAVTNEVRERKREKHGLSIAINFGEHSFQSLTRESTFETRSQYVMDTLELVSQIWPDADLYLLPHDKREWENHWSDASFCRLAYDLGKSRGYKVHLIAEEITHAEILTILPEMDLVISSRMHLSVAAIRSGVLPIVYTGTNKAARYNMSDKVSGMLKSRLGYSKLRVSSIDELRQILTKIAENGVKMYESAWENAKAKEQEDQIYCINLRAQMNLPEEYKEREIHEKDLLLRLVQKAEVERKRIQKEYQSQRIDNDKQKSWMLEEISRVNDELCQIGTWGQKTAAELEEVNREKAELLKEIERVNEELNKVGAWGQKTAVELEDVQQEKTVLLNEIERISKEIEGIKLLKQQSEQMQKQQMENMVEDLNREEMWLLKLLRDKEEDEKQKSWMSKEIQRVNDELCQVGAWGQRTDAELSIAKAELDVLRHDLNECESRFAEQEKNNNEMGLLDAERELHRIYNSRSWRMMTYMWRIRDIVLPCGSRRRRILKFAFRILRHPVKTVRLVNMTRFKKLLTEVKNGDWLLLKEQVLKCIGGADVEIEPIEILTLESYEDNSDAGEDNVSVREEHADMLEREGIFEKENASNPVESYCAENVDVHAEEDSQIGQKQSVCVKGEETVKPEPEPEIDRNVYKTLNIPQAKEPVVSIVIPVYNQFNYTYLCIKSIIRNSGSVPYEIIVADDCSTDMTLCISNVVNGVRVIRTNQNLRFLLNCNNAAKHARGKYILFLNNDTQVQKNWLSPLVELIERDEKIGMVGSKLIYPDGHLQEAGGILWKDGSAWNYGNRQNPAMPQYNYVKEADYISGAAIMIRKDIWQQLGGFDERFAPAYCEDSDLAFMVREAGYKVLYQPKSVVVHFEGVSNGTDTSSGLKAYQVTNQKKFYEKWKHVLDTHNENAVNVFNARDKSIGKKTILFVDHYVPTYDKDAGSRTVFAYLKMFVEQGFNVKFIGDNFYQSEPYTTTLQQMGIEVLYGSWYARNWKQWIKENAGCFDYAFLNRPHISVNYIDFLRENTKAKIIYYGHDLHFLRVMREYELTGEKRLLAESESWKEKELSLMRKADMSYYPSEVEAQAVHEIDRAIRVKAIPAYLFDDVKDAAYDAVLRKDLFFIGGFGHGPNIDAIKWLAKDVMPLLKEKQPQIQIHIAGSNMPKEIRDLEGNGLVMEGAVSDERLAELYAQCRMNVVPLRYGAGIKGKVVESMRFGLPVVTTSCGAEGIMNAQDCLVVADTAQALAEEIAALYGDGERLNALSKAGVEYVRMHYSSTNAVQVLNDEFGFADS